MMTNLSLSISTETASDLSAALAAALPVDPPAEPDPAPDLTALTARVDALEARKIWYGETPTGGEQVLDMVATGGAPYNFYVLYSLPLPDIKTGDLIEAHAQWACTNENANEYMIGCMLIIGDSAIDNSTGGAKQLSRPRTENLTKVMHHMRLNEHGSRRATANMTGKFVNVLGYCGRVGGAGATIRVEPNYGSVEVKVTPVEMLA